MCVCMFVRVILECNALLLQLQLQEAIIGDVLVSISFNSFNMPLFYRYIEEACEIIEIRI